MIDGEPSSPHLPAPPPEVQAPAEQDTGRRGRSWWLLPTAVGLGAGAGAALTMVLNGNTDAAIVALAGGFVGGFSGGLVVRAVRDQARR